MSVKRSLRPDSPVTYRGRRAYCQRITIVHEDMCAEREREQNSQRHHTLYLLFFPLIFSALDGGAIKRMEERWCDGPK